jgi:hypothetical protein
MIKIELYIHQCFCRNGSTLFVIAQSIQPNVLELIGSTLANLLQCVRGYWQISRGVLANSTEGIGKVGYQKR